MMKHFKLILAVAVITPVLTFGAKIVDLTADGGSILTKVDVGEVIVSNDTNDLNITYKIADALVYDKDAQDAENDGKWCIDATHTHAGLTLNDIPHNRPGLPKIGNFDSNEMYDCVDTAEVLSLPIPDGAIVGDEVIIAAHSVVKQFNYGSLNQEELDNLFSRPVTIQVTSPSFGSHSFLEMNITDPAPDNLLGGTNVEAWCVCAAFDILPGNTHEVEARLKDDPELSGCVAHPELLYRVEYILNKYTAHTPLEAVNGENTHICDIQNAIWLVMADPFYLATDYPGMPHDETECGGWYVQEHVDAIVEDTLANALPDYAPGCDESMLVVLDPDPEEGEIQTTVIRTPVPCEGSWGDETAWGGIWGDKGSATRFKSNNWSMWFPYTIEP